jgi:hypothetical protein
MMISPIKTRTTKMAMIIITCSVVLFILVAHSVLYLTFLIRKKLREKGIVSSQFTQFDRGLNRLRQRFSLGM